MAVVGDKYEIDVTGRLIAFIFQTDLGERGPFCFLREEEFCSVIRDDPILAESYGSSDRNRVSFEY